MTNYQVAFHNIAHRYSGSVRLSMDTTKCLLSGKFNFGWCTVCERNTIFLRFTPALREHYICCWCHSIPRQRALLHTLSKFAPGWRELAIHESSPSGASSLALQSQCDNYTATQFWHDIAGGDYKDGIRCENLESMTFAESTFDLVITQDVMEHVMHPDKAFAEIARILKSNGAHIFTVPWYKTKPTLVRARESGGKIQYLEPPAYHVNPIDPKGTLVVHEWGSDLRDYIHEHSGLETSVYSQKDRRMGLDGIFLDVFVSTKGEARG